MWIIAKLLSGLFTFLLKLTTKSLRHLPFKEKDGIKYFDFSYAKKGKQETAAIAIPIEGPVAFASTTESGFDRFFKLLGVTTEFQVGEDLFDNHTYIACDELGFLHSLQRDKELREQVSSLLKRGFKKISFDGQTLYAWSGKNKDPSFVLEGVGQLNELQNSLQKLLRNFQPHGDPFIKNALVVEAIIYSVFAYAITGGVELYFDTEDYHLDKWAIAKHGLLFGFYGSCILIGFIFLFLRKSSRGHRVIIESAIVLLFGFPWAGMQAVSDLNRSLDVSPSLFTPANVESKRINRRRKAPSAYTIEVNQPSVEDVRIRLPKEIEVSYELFSRVEKGTLLNFEIGQGRLNHSWYRKINSN